MRPLLVGGLFITLVTDRRTEPIGAIMRDSARSS